MAGPVRAKKHLGQHFLRHDPTAQRIVDGLASLNFNALVEVGPGDGVLSDKLFGKYSNLSLYDVDSESVAYLKSKYPEKEAYILELDFLGAPLPNEVAIIGNFPYNISSQIVFKILADREKVTGMVGMFQKEVAERIASPPGSKVYGILSVLTQAFYEVEYLFTVAATCFEPPPKVESGVIRMKRKEHINLACDERFFFQIVKRAFNQRRKMLRKSLKELIPENAPVEVIPYLTERPEQLTFNDFIVLAKALGPPK